MSQTLKPSAAAVATAREIIEQYEGWLRDRDDPPSLRVGYVHPGTRAIELARFVLADAA